MPQLEQKIPTILEELFSNSPNPEALLSQLMPILCQVMDCERCLLFLRDPVTKMGACTHSYSTRPEYPYPVSEWALESPTLVEDDPLFAEALRNPEALYVEDVENADPSILNIAFEKEYFAHSALIHAPIYYEGAMYGILEPCNFDKPRIWTVFDRTITAWVQTKLAPLAAEYARLKSL
ncbi:MAG: GAF domain-containing protein [Anaerolineae bacterium]|nr:GAF domain-containing protein [Gloeobacterales cyanobacterium ES-bin-313]